MMTFTNIPVYHYLLHQRPVIIERDEVYAADVALVEGGLVWTSIVIQGWEQVGSCRQQ